MKPNGETSIVLMTKAALMLAEANTIQKAKELKDLALTARDWATRKGLGDAAIQHARFYALEAERRMGELLAATERPEGGRPRKTGNGPGPVSEPTLADLGLTKNESSRAQMLASVPRETFDEVKAGEKSLSSVRRELKEANAAPPPPIPKGQYSVIYADPPWPVESMVLNKWESPLDDKYQTMTIDEIKALSIVTLAADDCSLFLWTTHTYLREAFDVLDAWGFKYHCCITWDKGSGWSLCGFHRRTEFCLYAYKGKINVAQSGEFIPTLISEPKRKHSQKPDIMYELIESNTPEPRIELFARIKRAGWTPWGNQV